MKKIICLVITISIAMSSIILADVIIQSDAINQSTFAARAELSNKINTTYSIMELPNGSYDGKAVGTIEFGSYLQNYDSNIRTPIEWYILEKRNSTAILLAKNVLDTHNYDTRDLITSWNTTRLKQWLNDSFFKNAFSQQEQELIILNPYRDVGRIFLLTPTEARYYFAGARNIFSYAIPTNKILAMNTYAGHRYRLEGQVDDEEVQYVDGSISDQKNYATSSQKLGVRPCIVVSYDVIPELKALLSPEPISNTSQLPAVQATIAPATGDIIIPSQNEEAFILYETERVSQVFNYKTDDDDGNAKTYVIKINLPIYAGGNEIKVALMNNLVQTSCFEILKSFAGDYVERKMDTVKKQLTLVPKPILELGNSLYSVRFDVGTNYLCTMYFDLKSGTCYSDTE